MLEDASRERAADREVRGSPGRVLDRTVSIDEVPAGHEAMNGRTALKVLARPPSPQLAASTKGNIMATTVQTLVTLNNGVQIPPSASGSSRPPQRTPSPR